jgi:hypothetical protein
MQKKLSVQKTLKTNIIFIQLQLVSYLIIFKKIKILSK